MNDIVSNELKNLALHWYVRMRSPDVSDEERLNHSNWLSRDAAHQDAYTAIQQEWRELDNLESWAIAEIRQLEERVVPSNRNRNILFWLGGMATTAIAATILFVMLPMVNQVEIYKYETMKGEQRKIVLEDGSRIHLNSTSSINVKFTAQEREINMLEGEGLFDVAHERNRPFVVRVRDTKIVAVGTVFSVYYKKDQIAVTVLEGRVVIMPADTPTGKVDTDIISESDKTRVLLESNRRAYINEKGQVKDVEVVDADKLTAWNRGLIILDNTPLREAAEEISRYIVGEVRVASNVPDFPVTGVIKIRDQETMLQLLSEVVPVTPVRQSSQLTMLYLSLTEPGSDNIN